MARKGKARGKRIATLGVPAATARDVRAGFSAVVRQSGPPRSDFATDGKPTRATAFSSSAAATKA